LATSWFFGKVFKAVYEHVHVNVHDYVYDYARFVTDCTELWGCLYVVVFADLRRGR
jgi:hypothetical protein